MFVKKILEKKPKFKVKAFKDGWSFSYNNIHVGAIWYDGLIGGICQETLYYNPNLK